MEPAEGSPLSFHSYSNTNARTNWLSTQWCLCCIVVILTSEVLPVDLSISIVINVSIFRSLVVRDLFFHRFRWSTSSFWKITIFYILFVIVQRRSLKSATIQFKIVRHFIDATSPDTSCWVGFIATVIGRSRSDFDSLSGSFGAEAHHISTFMPISLHNLILLVVGHWTRRGFSSLVLILPENKLLGSANSRPRNWFLSVLDYGVLHPRVQISWSVIEYFYPFFNVASFPVLLVAMAECALLLGVALFTDLSFDVVRVWSRYYFLELNLE